jgi:allantoinase
MTYDLAVRGTIVTPSGTIPGGWVGVIGGRVAAIGSGDPPDARMHYDVGSRSVLPGIVDGQTHAGSYRGLAGIESTTRSAVAGGITTIVDMPYDNPDPLTTMERLDAKIDAIRRLAHCDVALYATVAKRQGPEAVPDLLRAGVAALKISSFESHPVRFPRIPAQEMLVLLESVAPFDIPVGLHNEDQEIVLSRIAALKAEGKTAAEWHSPSRPPAAELAATAQFLELGAQTGAHVHIVHFSLGRGFDLVARYRAEGARATAELCVHYLWFDAAEDIPRLGARMKVNPPIREGERQFLWQALERGLAEFVSSDHSSWPIDNKLTPSIFDAGAGVPGLETLLPAFYTGLKRRESDVLTRTAAYLSERPARFFGLWPRKGAIAVGADADFVVIEEKPVRFDAARTHDDLNWSPFDGAEFAMCVAATFLRGKLVYENEQILSAPGDGRFVPRVLANTDA